jgi:hypothetical protein
MLRMMSEVVHHSIHIAVTAVAVMIPAMVAAMPVACFTALCAGSGLYPDRYSRGLRGCGTHTLGSTHCWVSSPHIQSPSGIGIGGCHTPSMSCHDGYGDGGTICPSMYIQPGPHFGESTHRPPRLSVAHWWSPTMTRITSSCSLSSAAYVIPPT